MAELFSGIVAILTFAGVLGAWPYIVERFGRRRR